MIYLPNVSEVDFEGKKEEDEDEEDAEIPENLRCGYFGWRPDWLQKYNNPRALLACVCWSTFVQGLYIYILYVLALLQYPFIQHNKWYKKFSLIGKLHESYKVSQHKNLKFIKYLISHPHGFDELLIDPVE